jgi:hypothetical protein
VSEGDNTRAGGDVRLAYGPGYPIRRRAPNTCGWAADPWVPPGGDPRACGRQEQGEDRPTVREMCRRKGTRATGFVCLFIIFYFHISLFLFPNSVLISKFNSSISFQIYLKCTIKLQHE